MAMLPITSKQIEQLAKLASHFPDAKEFTLHYDPSNHTLKVQATILERDDTEVDISNDSRTN